MKQETMNEIKETGLGLERKVQMPAVAAFCNILGGLSILFGGSMIVFAIANASKPAPDALSFVLEAIGIVISSIIWFAVARAITLLAQIAENTQK